MAKVGVATQKKTMTRKRLIVIVVLTTIVVAFVLLSPYGVFTRVKLEGDVDALNVRITEARYSVDSLRGIVKRLETDTTEIERLARERYGYVRPGEDVYIIRRDSTD